jgi:hypothetical protein
MLAALFRGSVKAVRLWPLVTVLWLINAVFGILFFVAAAYWLSLALDHSLATRTLLRDLDPNVLVDFYHHHGESFRLLVAVAALMAIGYVLLWFWLHGTVIFAVRAQRGTVSRAAWRSGLHTTAGMAWLFLIAAVALAILTGLVAVAAWAAWRWTIASPAPMLTYRIIGAAALIWVGGVVLLTAVHDHARIRVCATGEGPWAAYGWAWRFVLRGGEKAFLLAAALQLIALSLWVTHQSIGMAFPVGALVGLAGALVWSQMFLFVRMWIRVWFFAAQSELQG